MREVTGTAIYKADYYENIRDLIMYTCEKHAALDAFIFRRNPKESEIHRTFAEYGEDIRSLGTYILNSQYKGDPLFQEQALLATLWTKNINQFWYRFYDYIRLHPEGPMPRYYQEAAWLYGQLEERPNMDQLPFDDGVKDTFQRFMKAAEPYNNADVEDARIGLTYFNQTYYYDYYLMSRLPEY